MWSGAVFEVAYEWKRVNIQTDYNRIRDKRIDNFLGLPSVRMKMKMNACLIGTLTETRDTVYILRKKERLRAVGTVSC